MKKSIWRNNLILIILLKKCEKIKNEKKKKKRKENMTVAHTGSKNMRKSKTKK